MSYAPFSMAIIFSMPPTFAASSATALILLPAKNPVIEPPNFCAAVTALSEPWFNLPSLCSRMASDERNRERAERVVTGVDLGDLTRERTWRKADRLACGIIFGMVVVR